MLNCNEVASHWRCDLASGNAFNWELLGWKWEREETSRGKRWGGMSKHGGVKSSR